MVQGDIPAAPILFVPTIARAQGQLPTLQADMTQHVYARVDDPDKVKESNEGTRATT